jgi:hypothetical protein
MLYFNKLCNLEYKETIGKNIIGYTNALITLDSEILTTF